MKHIIAIISLILSFQLKAQVLSFIRLDVEDKGHVSLQWSYSNISQIDSVEIYRKEISNGTFERIFISKQPPFVDSHKDSLINASSKQYFYKVRVRSATAVREDTASTIFLETSNVRQENVHCLLSWSKASKNKTGIATIFRKTPNSGWVPIAQSGSNLYQDTLPPICRDIVSYKVEYQDTVGYCSNVSVVLFEDKAQTQPPTWGFVSVNPQTHLVELNWNPSPDQDIEGYFICSFFNEMDPCVALDTVYGKNTTKYICDSCLSTQIRHFRIYAFDSCRNVSPLTVPQNNIVLGVSVQSCKKKIRFWWNAFANMEGGILEYRIYEHRQGWDPVLLARVQPDTTDYLYEVETASSISSFYVQAVSRDEKIISYSNKVDLSLYDLFLKKFIEITEASVEDDNRTIRLNVRVDPLVGRESKELYRGRNLVSPRPFTTILNEEGPYFEFLDTLLMAGKNTYSYYFRAEGGCFSNQVQTMRTEVSMKGVSNLQIAWTPYIGWDQSVRLYEVERKIGVNGHWGFVGSVSGRDTLFVDEVQDLMNSKDRIFYRVIANSYLNQRAISAFAEFIREGEMFLPNAFTPRGTIDGSNTLFKPILYFHIESAYSFRIYNRFGELVFETNNPNEGWDGKYRGRPCPMGGYVYLVDCVFSNGKVVSKKGSVLLIE